MAKIPAWVSSPVFGGLLALVAIMLAIWWFGFHKRAESAKPNPPTLSEQVKAAKAELAAAEKEKAEKEELATLKAKLSEAKGEPASEESPAEPTAPAGQPASASAPVPQDSTPAASAPAPSEPAPEVVPTPGQTVDKSVQKSNESPVNIQTVNRQTVAGGDDANGLAVNLSVTAAGSAGVNAAGQFLRSLGGNSADTVGRKVAETKQEMAEERVRELKAKLDAKEDELMTVESEKLQLERKKAELDAKIRAADNPFRADLVELRENQEKNKQDSVQTATKIVAIEGSQERISKDVADLRERIAKFTTSNVTPSSTRRNPCQ